jgi:hypothetical protein
LLPDGFSPPHPGQGLIFGFAAFGFGVPFRSPRAHRVFSVELLSASPSLSRTCWLIVCVLRLMKRMISAVVRMITPRQINGIIAIPKNGLMSSSCKGNV